MKRFSRILCIILTVLAISCQKEKELEIVKVTGVTLNSTSLTLTEGESQTLSATVSPQDAANKKVTWSTSNASVASVDNGGKVTASAAGSATITVTTDDGGKTATCKVTVEAKFRPVTSVTLDKESLEITVGDTDVKLTATVAPENATDKSVNWSSSAESVATVDQNGNVKAVAPGYATITVTTVDGGKTATCDVKVKAAIPEGPLPGEFSVSIIKTVHFSQGNLWYGKVGDAQTATFNFEANQYDIKPAIEGSWSSDHISHFYWSKTVSVAYAEKYDDDTRGVDVFFTNLEGFKVNVGGTEQTGWRTLSTAEWQYLFNDRTNAASKVGYAIVGGVIGIIILPDNFTDPMKNNGNGAFVPKSSTGWTQNVYTSGDNWNAMETAGAVFLPAAGWRNGSTVIRVGAYGCYWSSIADASYCAPRVSFSSSNVYPGSDGERSNGYSVRLVTESK